jgi:hypothetical protein
MTACLVFAAVRAAAQVVGLNEWIETAAAWKASPDSFMVGHRSLGFAFADGKRVACSTAPNLRFLDFKVWEARVFFAQDGIGRVELSLYNKGDAGKLDQEAFKDLVDRVCNAISVCAGS